MFAGNGKLSIDSFIPLSAQCGGAEGQVVYSLCTISIQCAWKTEVSEHPMQDLPMLLPTLEAVVKMSVQGMSICSPKDEGQHF